MKNYYTKKNELKEKAIEWQHSFAEGKSYSWFEIAQATNFFEKQAQRYGLVKEFKEEGII